MNKYQTIAEESEGIYKDKGSKFIAIARPTFTEEAVHDFLSEIRRAHFKARHHCLAYRIGLSEITERCSDDGEPSGSAGAPMLNQLKSFDVVNVAVIVVRYFGGTKLGVSGLIQAYKQAVRSSLENARIMEKDVYHYYQLNFDYAIMTEVMSLIKEDYLICSEKRLEEKGCVILGFKPSERQEVLLKVTSKLNHLPIEAVQKPIFDTAQYSLNSLGLR